MTVMFWLESDRPPQGGQFLVWTSKMLRAQIGDTVNGPNSGIG